MAFTQAADEIDFQSQTVLGGRGFRKDSEERQKEAERDGEESGNDLVSDLVCGMGALAKCAPQSQILLSFCLPLCFSFLVSFFFFVLTTETFRCWPVFPVRGCYLTRYEGKNTSGQKKGNYERHDLIVTG